ncbi:MAG: PEP-CTERM sorting domain-containing protein [Akkermansia muciniphila]|nr:PEP-CTERM sorting domain-containing protein [Akkermansia muciniphila]
MRLHLPKALLAAVLAACLAWPAGATDYTASCSANGTEIKCSSDGGTTKVALTDPTAQDTITFDVSAGYLFDATSGTAEEHTIAANLVITQLNMTNGYSGRGTTAWYYFTGSVSGSGEITRTAAQESQGFSFSGGMSEYSGNITINGKGGGPAEGKDYDNILKLGAIQVGKEGAAGSIIVNANSKLQLAGTTIWGNVTSVKTEIGEGNTTFHGNLTNTGTLTNNGTLTISGSYTGGTITQGDDASLTLASGSVVNVGGMTFSESIGDGSTAARVDSASGFQTYSGSYTLATGGTITNQNATFKVGGETFTGGSLSGNEYTVAETRYNIAENSTKSISVVQQAATDGSISSYYINILGSLTGVSDDSLTHGIRGTGSIQVDASTSLSYAKLDDKGAEFTGSINVLGSLTGVSDLTLRHTIDGSGVVQINTGDTLSYSKFTAKKASTFTGSINVLGELSGLSGTIATSIQGNGTLTFTGDACIMADNGANVTLAGEVDAGSYELAANGSGTLNIINNASIGSLHAKASSITIGDGTNASVTTATRIEHGDAKSAGTTLTVSANSVLKITGNKNEGTNVVGDYKILSAVLGEWDASTTANISGTVLAENAKLLAGDTGFTLNIKSNGLVATKGIDRAVTVTNPTIAVNLEGGSLILGDSGIAANGTRHSATSTGGVIGSYANTTTIATGLSLTSGTTTFDTSKYTIDNTNNTVTVGANASASSITVTGNISADDGTVLKVTGVGALELSGTNTLYDLKLSGGTTTISGTTTVNGTKFDYADHGIYADDAELKLQISDNGKLIHDGFYYVGTELKGLTNGLSMWNGEGADGIEVTGGSLEQTADAKSIYAKLSNVKLINASDKTSTLGVDAELSGASIGGTLRVGRDDMTWNEATQQYDKRVLEKVTVTVSGKADVTGEVKIETGSTFKLTGQDTTSSIATLTGSGTLKTTGGKTKVATATGFTGTLAATGGNIELQSATALALSEVVVSGGSSISGAESYTADKVSIGAGAAGSLVGSLSINTNGTITLDASAGATTETGGTKGLSLSALTTTFADEGSTSTTVSLTLGSGLTLNLLNLNVKQGDSLTLFSGVTSAVYGDGTTALTADGIEANTVFSNLTEGDFKLSYSNNIVALVAQRDVPEPTTATLSLLALMGLAARRRRRKA